MNNKRTLSEMGFNIKNNYGPNIEVNDGGKVTLVQDKNGLWYTVEAEVAEVVEEVDGVEVKASVENQKPDTPIVTPQTANQRVATCFEQGLLSVGKPYNKLFCLMAAMIARRMLKEKTVPAFVRMVSSSYPALIQDGVTEENYIGAINDLTQKSRYNFSNYITDQKTMIDFVKSCYPTTSTGKERKDSQLMVAKTNEIFLFLKVD